MKLSVTWELTDAEYAALQRLVAAEGKNEAVEDYATRVGLKGIRGVLENELGKLREQAIDAVTTAWDAADARSKVAALDALGFEIKPDGSVSAKD